MAERAHGSRKGLFQLSLVPLCERHLAGAGGAGHAPPLGVRAGHHPLALYATDARAEYAFLVATREAIFSASRDDLRVDDGSLAVNSNDSRSTDDSENRVAQTESCESFFTSSETSSLVEALLAAAERTKEEGARAVVAECLGRLAARETSSFLNDDDDDERSEGLGLMARLRGDARDARLGPGRRSTAIAAAKHAVLHCYTPAARAARAAPRSGRPA